MFSLVVLKIDSTVVWCHANTLLEQQNNLELSHKGQVCRFHVVGAVDFCPCFVDVQMRLAQEAGSHTKGYVLQRHWHRFHLTADELAFGVGRDLGEDGRNLCCESTSFGGPGIGTMCKTRITESVFGRGLVRRPPEICNPIPGYTGRVTGLRTHV